jgi:hypothetical protein
MSATKVFSNSNTDSCVLKNRILANRLKVMPKIKSYTLKQKCYGVEDFKDNAHSAKKYVKELADPDILGLQDHKRWNINAKLDDKSIEKRDLDQILFNVQNGLTDTNTVKLKDRKIYDGVDVKYDEYFKWNNSSTFKQKDKENIHVKM